MNSLYPFCSDIDLYVKGRISSEDALRQKKTAVEILKRLAKQPGMIASFSRALVDGLSYGMSEEAYNDTLDASIQSIFEASKK